MEIDAANQPFVTMRGNHHEEACPIPTFNVGSLILLISEGKLSHAAIINQIEEKEGQRTFCAAAWQMEAEAYLSDLVNRVGNLTNFASYVGAGRFDETAFVGTAGKLQPALASKVRLQVGLSLPENLRGIYLTDREQAALRSEAENLQRFIEAANEQLAALE